MSFKTPIIHKKQISGCFRMERGVEGGTTKAQEKIGG